MKLNSIRRKLLMFTLVSMLLIAISTAVFYSVSYDATKREVTGLFQAIFSQMNGQLDAYINESASIVRLFSYNMYARNYLAQTSLARKYEYFRTLNDLYLTAVSIQHNLRDLILLDAHGAYLSLGGQAYSAEALRAHTQGSQGLNIAAVHDISPRYIVKTDKNNLIVTAPVNAFTPANERLNVGYIVCILDMQPLITRMEDLSITRSAQMLLFDADNHFVTGTAMSDALRDAALQPGPADDTFQADGVTYLRSQQVLDKTGFQGVCLVPQSEVFLFGQAIIRFGIALVVVNAAIICFMGLSVMRQIGTPIRHLLNTIQKVRGGNLNERVRSKDTGEIGNLANNFDEMMDRVNSLTETIMQNQFRMYALQLRQNETEAVALQSQMNPHFLYNTLACIQGIAIYNHQQDIASIARGLARIYEYILRMPDRVTVRQEVEIVGRYLDIQRIRMGDRLKTHIDVEPELMAASMMKLLLQPLVENAVEHGVSKKLAGGTVSLTGRMDGAQIVLTVVDDGVGMDAASVTEIEHLLAQEAIEDTGTRRTHLGLYNVIKRLQLMYQDAFRFQCQTTSGEGTRITVRMPLTFQYETETGGDPRAESHTD